MEFRDIVKGMTKEEIEEMVRYYKELNKKETLNEVENIKERK